jgi:hypothetical protein
MCTAVKCILCVVKGGMNLTNCLVQEIDRGDGRAGKGSAIDCA